VELTALACTSCGFVCYYPRPSTEDLTAKYTFLREHETLGSAHGSGRRVERLLAIRTAYLCNAVMRLAKRRPDRVLDIGGGDGRLLRPFVKLGSECYLVDFNQSPIAGVCRLGNQLEEIPSGRNFDLIICSHVLEHVADPGGTLKIAANLLSPSGVLYVEVPLEVWKGVPISEDPVTHINFFTTAALKTAVSLAGLSPIQLETRMAPYGKYYMRVLSVVARRGNGLHPDKTGSGETLGLLAPSFWSRCLRFCGNMRMNLLLNAAPGIESCLAKLSRSNRV